MQSNQDEQWKFWMGLQQVRRIGHTHVDQLLLAFDNDLEAAWHAPRAQLAAILGPRVADSIIATRAEFDLEERAAATSRLGHTVITYRDDRYPLLLKETSAPPLVLYVLGELVPEDDTAVAVIGSRDSTHYGRDAARSLSSEIASSGVTVVSGLARGIDGVAHRAALQVGGRTIAVLGGSLDWIYPSEHQALARQISEQGALVSEYPTRSRPVPGNFRARNRIMAGLSVAVVIVEARLKSGTLITASYAAHYNREVFAVPGSIFSEASEGCHQLLRDGAGLVRNAADILRELQLETAPAPLLAEIDEAVGEIERAILQTLGREPAHIDDIAAELDLTITDVATALMMLELSGRIRNAGSQHFVRA